MTTYLELRLQARANVRWLKAAIRQVNSTIEDLRARSAKGNQEAIRRWALTLKRLKAGLAEEEFYSTHWPKSPAPIVGKEA